MTSIKYEILTCIHTYSLPKKSVDTHSLPPPLPIYQHTHLIYTHTHPHTNTHIQIHTLMYKLINTLPGSV